MPRSIPCRGSEGNGELENVGTIRSEGMFRTYLVFYLNVCICFAVGIVGTEMLLVVLVLVLLVLLLCCSI